MTFGNNDCRYHDNAPPEAEKTEYYSFIYKLWFENHTPNKPFAAAAKETLLNGGYYRADISSDVSILELNTMAYNTDALPELIGQSAADQMKWLAKTLEEATDRKFIILDHIYGGARFKHDNTKKAQSLWAPEYLDQYLKIWEQNSDKIMIELAGHDHWEDLRVTDNDATNHPSRNLFVSAGISPDHN
jgi:hypothetical protein